MPGETEAPRKSQPNLLVLCRSRGKDIVCERGVGGGGGGQRQKERETARQRERGKGRGSVS